MAAYNSGSEIAKEQAGHIQSHFFKDAFKGLTKLFGKHSLLADSRTENNHDQVPKKSEAVRSRQQKYYSGHVRRLGHYFRNFYQTVKYVDSQDFLTPDKKYEYLTTYRSQMSYYEQSVFLFNSLSDVGRSWEYEIYDRFSPESLRDKRRWFNRLLVTKYDLLRNMMNIDGYVFEGLSVKEFYPLLHIERGFECKVSGILPFETSPIKICRFCFNERYIGNTNTDNGQKEVILRSGLKEEEIQCDEVNCITRQALEKVKGMKWYKAFYTWLFFK